MFQGDKFSQSIDDEIESRIRAIMDLLALMKLLTAYSIRLLIDLKRITVATLTEYFKKSRIRLHYNDYKWVLEGNRANLTWEFNDRVRKWNHPGASFIINELPIIDIGDSGRIPDVALFQEFLYQYFRCFDQLRRWMSEYCAEYEVPEGGFPYLPTSTRRVYADGSTEKLLKNYCILTMDIIRSTDDEQTGTMKNAVLDAIARYRQTNFFSQKTHDDAFVVCADNPKILWDICYAIAIAGEQIRIDPSRMWGTRKGLAIGSIYATTDPNGVCMIRDAWAPHALPRAFSILRGVDEFARKNGLDPNFLVIVDDITLENFIRPLGLKPLGTEFVSGKHFVGSCHIVKLSA
jgi:hypothetical protein